jgi:hypothetical protein
VLERRRGRAEHSILGLSGRFWPVELLGGARSLTAGWRQLSPLRSVTITRRPHLIGEGLDPTGC